MRTLVEREGSIEVDETGEVTTSGERAPRGSRPPVAKGVAAESLDELYRRERPGLLRLAYLLVGSSEAAEDVFHDAVASAAPHLEAADKPGAYLRTSVVMAANAWHRRAKRPLPEPAAERTVELDARTLELWESLNVLTDRRRSVVVLRYYLDLPVNEIAKHLDCAPSTVSSLLHRAMADLRKELAHD